MGLKAAGMARCVKGLGGCGAVWGSNGELCGRGGGIPGTQATWEGYPCGKGNVNVTGEPQAGSTARHTAGGYNVARPSRRDGMAEQVRTGQWRTR